MSILTLLIVGGIGYAILKTAPGGNPPGVGLGDIGSTGAVAASRSDLSSRLYGNTGLPTASQAITTISIESANWSDASLGVPKAGGISIQLITPGYKIILSAGGRNYEYHTNASGSSVALVGG